MINEIKSLYRLCFRGYNFRNIIYCPSTNSYYPKSSKDYRDEKTIEQFIIDGFQ